MKFLREQLDSVEPHFLKGGKLEKLYPLYEAKDTFLFSPGETAEGNTHVRDSLDLKRMMITVVLALGPCILMALYNTGYQANLVIAEVATEANVPAESLQLGGWRSWVMDLVGVKYRFDTVEELGSFYTPGLANFLLCVLHGALYFFPVYIVCMAAGGIVELIFSIVRGHEINEGFLVSGILFPLTLPPTIPLWQVAVGIVFGVVVGKEIFGGTGRNFLNPALTARAFLYFAYAPDISGGNVWTAVNSKVLQDGAYKFDGYSGATALNAFADGAKVSDAGVLQMTGKFSDSLNGGEVAVQLSNSMTWFDAFIGNCHGSMGETSVLACLLGAGLLIFMGIGSWRIMTGCLAGAIGLSLIFYLFQSESMPILGIPPWWHLVVGGFAFGTVFMATDPVSAAMTDHGKWIYGVLIGATTIMVRSINPAFPEGIMLAILFGNTLAPLIDFYVVQANINRRQKRVSDDAE
ncbi:NADH:ubiquinone reductase (Na(+)-transporting) subunit B [Pirellulaceae bacterium]|nr:NADH:ubiquinone reductase (Na(+)-transporting) subunit B [Pirellulaceae bacterium]